MKEYAVMKPEPDEFSTVRFYNVFSVFMTREMLPVLSKEHQRQKDVVELYKIIQEGDFVKAAALVSESPQLRTDDIFMTFKEQGVKVLKHYLSVMVRTRSSLSKLESLELVKLVLSEDAKANLPYVAMWIMQGKFTLSQELGDFIRLYDVVLAAKIYISISIPDKILDCFKQLHQYRRMITYAMAWGYKIDWLKELKLLYQENPVESFELAIALAETKGGSPVELDLVCKMLEIDVGDEWDMKKLLKARLEELQQQTIEEPQLVEDDLAAYLAEEGGQDDDD